MRCRLHPTPSANRLAAFHLLRMLQFRETSPPSPLLVLLYVWRLRNREAKAVKEYRCTSCHARLIAGDVATDCTCPHCGAKAKLVMQNSQVKPISYVPFVVTRRQAIKNCELGLKKEARLPEGFPFAESVVCAQGIFVPCWLKSGEVDFDFSFDVDDGNPLREDRMTGYERRAGRLAFSRVPVSGSAYVSDEVLGSLGTYNLRPLKPFSDKALVGFVTEPFTTSGTRSNELVERRLKDVALSKCEGDSVRGYSWKNASPRHCYSRAVVFFAKPERALLPAWLLTLSLNGRNRYVAVNGQTGVVAWDDQSKGRAESMHRAVVLSYKRGLTEDALTIALSEPRLGPCQETDRWPERKSRL